VSSNGAEIMTGSNCLSTGGVVGIIDSTSRRQLNGWAETKFVGNEGGRVGVM